MSRHFDLMNELEGHLSRVSENAHADLAGSERQASPKSSPVQETHLSLATLIVEHWRLIGMCMAAGLALAIVATVLLPKKYASEVRFLVRNERKDLTITPTNAAQNAPSGELSEEDVNSEMQVLMSHDLLEGVVLENHLYKSVPSGNSATPDLRAVERAVIKLSSSLEVSTIRKTNVIQARYRAGNPELAAKVLSDLSHRYLNAHLAAHSTPGTYTFFSSELEQYRDRLKKAEEATSAFRRVSQIYSSDQQRSALVAQMQDVDARYQNADADLRERQARLNTAGVEENAASARIPTDERSSVNQLTIDHLQSELADMENKRIDMAMKYKSGDRALQELDSEIANTRKNLSAARVEYAAEKTTAVNPLRQTLTAMQSDDRININALKARRAALASIKAENLTQLKTFNGNALTLSNLQQEEDIARQNFDSYSRRYEEAKLADQMDKQKFGNVFIIETPTASPLPVSPKLLPNLVIGGFLGAITGLLLAFFRSGKEGEYVVAMTRFSNEVIRA